MRPAVQIIHHLAKAFTEEQHPRVPAGQTGGGEFTSGADGESTGTGTKSDPIVTSDVLVAAKALGENKYVQLKSVRQVSTLLGKLKDIVDEAKAKGEKAGVYDLCKVTIPGTSLFCVESKNVPRVQMPQLKGVPTPGSKADALLKDKNGEVDLAGPFVEHLHAAGISVTDEVERADYLKATQCHDALTETLTEYGWMGLDELKVHTANGTMPKIASFNTESQQIHYEQPLAGMTLMRHSGPIYRFIGQVFDLAVTPNHRLFIRKQSDMIPKFCEASSLSYVSRMYAQVSAPGGMCGGVKVDEFVIPEYPLSGRRVGLRIGEYHKERNDRIRDIAAKIAAFSFATGLCACGCGKSAVGEKGFHAPGHRGKQGYYQRVADEVGKIRRTVQRVIEDPNAEYSARRIRSAKMRPKISLPMDAWLAWLGWYIAEGHAGMVSQSIKSPWIDEIKRVCKSLGVKGRECVSADGQWFWCPKEPGQYVAWLEEHVGTHAYNKRIPEFVFSLPKEQQWILLRGLMRGDGWTGGKDKWESLGASRLGITSEQLADDAQRLAMHCGFFAQKQEQETYMTKRGERTEWFVRLRKGASGARGTGNAALACLPKPIKEEYDGEVYCFTLPRGTLITRRNGIVAIQGNSELNGGKVAGMVAAIESGKNPAILGEPIFTAGPGNYILDGHHRWAAAVGASYREGLDKPLTMKVRKVDMDIIPLLKAANNFATAWGIPQADVSKSKCGCSTCGCGKDSETIAEFVGA